MANSRKITFGTETFYPSPGSVKIQCENQDAGTDIVGAGCRNAAACTVSFEFVPGSALYVGGSVNPTFTEANALRTQTFDLPDESGAAGDCSVYSEFSTTALVELEKCAFTLDSADGDGALLIKAKIKGSFKALQPPTPTFHV